MGFTVGEHSAFHLRRILRLFLKRWGLPELTDPAELALTELVANVVRHVPGRHCTTLILKQPDGLRVEISDNVPMELRPVHDADPLAESGRGLLLVDAVTDRWGSLEHREGKVVWFECDAKP
ncbi:ATP-binding protein [Streptomyces sp. NPDC127084]|uniref:ATP-binding protein n=1 Tax=Streptomyces sp. NPDC127084 TaxID=3347133 RepID=UPI00365B0916